MTAVSVLTTCYNREPFIGEAIESVLSSSFSDFEYIIVDDHSSDRSAEIARKYGKIDPRVKIYVNERNLGDYPNRSRAASLARGAYLKYVDSDDIIYPHGLQVMMECMRRFPAAGLGLSQHGWCAALSVLPRPGRGLSTAFLRRQLVQQCPAVGHYPPRLL